MQLMQISGVWMLSEPGNSRRRIRRACTRTCCIVNLLQHWDNGRLALGVLLDKPLTHKWIKSIKSKRNAADMELKVHFSNIKISVISNFRLCPGTWQSDLICFEMFSQGARGGDHRVSPGFGQGLRKEALAGRGPGDDHQHHRHHDYYPHLDHPHRHHDRHINHQIISHQEKSLKFVSTCFAGVSLWYTRVSRTCHKGRVSGLFALQ